MSELGVSGHRNWTFYQPGSSPILLTAPHGGSNSAICLPDRSESDFKTPRHSKFVTTNDLYSLDFAHDLKDALLPFGLRPHLVANNLRRLKLDPNRPLEEACPRDSEATIAYRNYHAFIEKAIAACDESQPVFLLDLHGHGKRHSSVQLGYLLDAAALNSGQYSLEQSSLSMLSCRTNAGASDIISGPSSLGALLNSMWEAEAQMDSTLGELQVLPSLPDQVITGNYFSGGYTLQRWSGARVAGIQVEVSYDLREVGQRREAFLKVLARAVSKFWDDAVRPNPNAL